MAHWNDQGASSTRNTGSDGSWLSKWLLSAVVFYQLAQRSCLRLDEDHDSMTGLLEAIKPLIQQGSHIYSSNGLQNESIKV